MFFAGIVICNLVAGSAQCTVKSVGHSGVPGFETRAECDDAFNKGLTLIYDNNKEKIEAGLASGALYIAGGCLLRPSNWVPLGDDYLKRFGPNKAKDGTPS